MSWIKVVTKICRRSWSRARQSDIMYFCCTCDSIINILGGQDVFVRQNGIVRNIFGAVHTWHTILYSQLLFSSPATQPVDLSNSVGLFYSIYNTSQIALRPKTSAAIKQLFFSLSGCLIWKLIKSACVTLVFKQVLKSLTRVSKLHKSSDKSCA